MKSSLLFVLVLVSLSSASPLVGLGQKCDKYNIFVVTAFTAVPYPPTAGQKMNITMSGTFSETMYIADIAVITRYNSGHYVYSYVDVGNTYTYGQVYTFNFPITAGTGAGLYDNLIELQREQGKSISCWSFTYHI